jgi:probable phosphomutase (TIGR03848 family)
VATLVLLRHARSTANGSGVLAGRSPGVGLDERGRAQAAALVARLAPLPLVAVLSSPLQRCVETLAPLVAQRALEPVLDDRLLEVDYGDWTNRPLRELGSDSLWSVVQQHPSAAVFPGGEGLAAVQARAVAAIREWDAKITAAHGPRAIWLACSHGDVIKAILADGLGVHLDGFQRIVVDPCSVSAVRYTPTRPFVLSCNNNGADLSGLIPPEPPAEDGKDKPGGGPESAPSGHGAQPVAAHGASPASDATIGGSTG